MMINGSPMETIAQDALAPGPFVEPTQLLNVVATFANPVLALINGDDSNALFDALYAEFGLLQAASPFSGPSEPLDEAKWTNLLRWVIEELRRWKDGPDQSRQKIVAVFVVTQAMDWDGGLWPLMPHDIGSNPELVAYLSELVRKSSLTLTPKVEAPIYQREALESFAASDNAGDWKGIIDIWASLDHWLWPSAFHVQVVRCLHHCGSSHLVTALENLRQTPFAMISMGALTIEQRLGAAIAGANAHIHLAALYETLKDRQTGTDLGSKEQDLLTQLLLKISKDEAEWSACMQVFNVYPIRFPHLQIALGHTLADSSDTALEVYIRSINLTATPIVDENRKLIAECLKEFGIRATPERRSELWRRAYTRWIEWDFDRRLDRSLLEVRWSQIDYAVVGYAVECLNDTERDAMLEDIRAKLQTLDNGWHRSSADIISAWNRLLSKLQPFAHAVQMEVGQAWLTENAKYLPPEANDMEYLRMKYKLG